MNTKILQDGTKTCRENHLLHNEHGPAVECPDGTKAWYKHGLLHRDAAPAIEYSNGAGVYYKDGIRGEVVGTIPDWTDAWHNWYMNDPNAN